MKQALKGRKGTRLEYATESEKELNSTAIRLYNEYMLVSKGICSYVDLGYSTIDGKPPAAKIHELMFIQRLVVKHTPRPQKPMRSGR